MTPMKFLILTLLLPTSANAEEWKTVATEPYLIQVRQDSVYPDIQEIRAEGIMNAKVEDIEATLMDVERFRFFMPYVKESRVLKTIYTTYPEQGDITYTRVVPPFVTPRDYVCLVTYPLRSKDGGVFLNKWKIADYELPERSNCVRLKINQGYWLVTGEGEKSHFIYSFMVDPGGWIPPAIANLGSSQGVTDTIKAVEKEAQKR